MKSGKISKETSPVQIEFPFQRTNGKIFPFQNLRGKFPPNKGEKNIAKYQCKECNFVLKQTCNISCGNSISIFVKNAKTMFSDFSNN